MFKDEKKKQQNGKRRPSRPETRRMENCSKELKSVSERFQLFKWVAQKVH